MPIHLSIGYERTFARLLEDLGGRTDAGSEEMAVLWPMSGIGYRSELMVIGQAPNGWEGRFDLKQLKYPENRARVIKKARKVAQLGICNHPDRCPMLWVTDQWNDRRPGYGTGKSPFWRVIRHVVDALNLADISRDEWPSVLAWSDLYKVSPKAGGNPSASLIRAQQAIAVELIGAEISELAPNRVLVLTGFDWFAPFVDGLALSLDREAARIIEAQGIKGRTHWIVARYPARLPSGVTELEFATTLATAFVSARTSRT